MAAEGESAGKREMAGKNKKIFKIMCQKKKVSWVSSSVGRKENLKALWNKARVHSLRESSTEGSFPPDAVIHPYPDTIPFPSHP